MKKYKNTILRPLAKNLDIPDFWEWISGIELYVVRKRCSLSIQNVDDVIVESKALDKMVEAIRAEKYDFVDSDSNEGQIHNLFKWLYKMTDHSVMECMMRRTFYESKKQGFKSVALVDEKHNDDEDNKEAEAIQRLKDEYSKAGIEYSDTDTVEDVNAKIRNIPLTSRYYKGRSRKYNTKDAILEVIDAMGDDGWLNENRQELVDRVTELATANKCKFTENTIRITISQMKRALGKTEVGQANNMQKMAYKHYRAGMTFFEFCNILAPFTDKPDTVRQYYSQAKSAMKKQLKSAK